MTDALVQWIVQNLGSSAGKELTTFIISMTPILELRGGLLAASPALLNVPMWRAIPIAIIGNMLPIPFILWLIKPIFNWMRQRSFLRPIVEKLENKALSKREEVEKYEFWGLVIFVGIPLPGTGAWTGALIATLLDIDIKKATLSIFIGVLMAAVIMTILSYGVLGFFA